MKRLCTICARKGSKGVRNKNIMDLCGKPLIVYSIIQAQESGLFDAIAVSSDSSQILAVAREWGADYLVQRPGELATDQAEKLPAIRHCVAEVETMSGADFDVIVDLDATSPLRIVDDIKGAVDLLERDDAANVITGAPSRHSPYFNLVEVGKDGVVSLAKQLSVPAVRRQDTPACYDMNASVYVWRRDVLFSNLSLFNAGTRLYVMPEERSVDLDSELDFLLIQQLMRKSQA